MYEVLTSGYIGLCSIYNFNNTKLTPNEKYSSSLNSYTLAGDCGLVSTHLFLSKIKLTILSSNLGDTKSSNLLRSLIKKESIYYEGEFLGNVDNRQYVSEKGETYLFADIASVQNSLLSGLKYIQNKEYDIAYLDSYIWLNNFRIKFLDTINAKKFLLNFGNYQLNHFLKELNQLLYHSKSNDMILQISIIGDLSLEHEKKLTQLSSNFTAIILTQGEQGMNLFLNKNQYSFNAIKVNNFINAAGAGSAVSAEIINLLVQNSLVFKESYMIKLLLRGAKMCQYSGSIEESMFNRLNELLIKSKA